MDTCVWELHPSPAINTQSSLRPNTLPKCYLGAWHSGSTLKLKSTDSHKPPACLMLFTLCYPLIPWTDHTAARQKTRQSNTAQQLVCKHTHAWTDTHVQTSLHINIDFFFSFFLTCMLWFAWKHSNVSYTTNTHTVLHCTERHRHHYFCSTEFD